MRISILALLITWSCTACRAQSIDEKNQFQSVRLAGEEYKNLKDFKTLNDADITRLLGIINSNALDSVSEEFDNVIILYSANTFRDPNHSLTVIGVDSSGLQYYNEQLPGLSPKIQPLAAQISSKNELYLQFRGLFDQVNAGFFKQSFEIDRKKPSPSRSLFFMAKKQGGAFNAGVFAFDNSEFKEADSEYPSKSYEDLILWISLNCQ